MNELPDHYPFAAAPITALLEWAHMAEPPFGKVREAAPWLKRDEEVRCYLEGLIESRVFFWRNGPLFPEVGS